MTIMYTVLCFELPVSIQALPIILFFLHRVCMFVWFHDREGWGGGVWGGGKHYSPMTCSNSLCSGQLVGFFSVFCLNKTCERSACMCLCFYSDNKTDNEIYRAIGKYERNNAHFHENQVPHPTPP